MAGGERLGPSPVDEGVATLPDRVTDVLAFGVAAQQRELNEARHLIEVALALAPLALEVGLASLDHLEVVHRDEHARPPAIMSCLTENLSGRLCTADCTTARVAPQPPRKPPRACLRSFSASSRTPRSRARKSASTTTTASAAGSASHHPLTRQMRCRSRPIWVS